MRTPNHPAPVIFISYAHKDVAGRDKDWLTRLKVYLKQFCLEGDLAVWDDRCIPAGSNWRNEIQAAIERCSVAVFLVGPYSLASEFIHREEMPKILASAHKKILPLVTGYCNYAESALGAVQPFNPPDRPLESLSKKQQDEALRDFSLEVRCRAGTVSPVVEQDTRVELSLAIKTLGIAEGWIRLDQSRFKPIDCMERCHRHLSFLGNLGNKWVKEPQFQQFLRRMNALHAADPAQGLVRFLILNPESDAFKQLEIASEGSIDGSSIEELRLLSKAYPCFQVKLYSCVPCFRLTFIDGIELGFAPYRFLGCGVVRAGLGHEAPHLLVRRDNNWPWSLYETFERYFDQLWSARSTITLSHP
jgi:hypothetical protein